MPDWAAGLVNYRREDFCRWQILLAFGNAGRDYSEVRRKKVFSGGSREERDCCHGTALLGEIMGRHFSHVHVVGNIGIPYTAMVKDTRPDSVTVAEISSFQLETVHTFCPQVSAILNITPDHLNRHHTMENYQEAKKRIARNQGSGQVCVLNYEDSVLREFASQVKASVLFFSSARKLEEGIYLEGDRIVWAAGGEASVVCSTRDLQLIGKHNYDKGSEYDAWIQAFGGKVKKLVLLGATREKIRDTAIRLGYPPEDILLTGSLQEAVDQCVLHAANGDAVLLSPACASWGMFQNYEERGEQFKEIVRAIK